MKHELLPGEQVLIETGLHRIVMLRNFIVALVIYVFLVAVASMIPDFRLMIRLYIALGGLLIGTVIVLIEWIRWKSTTLLVTTHRLLLRRGILRRAEYVIPLAKVQDVTLSQSIGARLLGYGHLSVSAAGRDGPMLIQFVSRPRKVRDAIIGGASGLQDWKLV
jgi:uncharacterized membrane protein YdbT with pleckstrin-like domain